MNKISPVTVHDGTVETWVGENTVYAYPVHVISDDPNLGRINATRYSVTEVYTGTHYEWRERAAVSTHRYVVAAATNSADPAVQQALVREVTEGLAGYTAELAQVPRNEDA